MRPVFLYICRVRFGKGKFRNGNVIAAMPAPLCWEPSSNIALYSIWHTIIEGFVAGLTLSMMFGPAFFTLLQTSLERGFKAAVRLAFGIFLSDTLLVAISFLGASRVFTDPEASKIIGLIGGAILVFIGIYTFRKKVSFQEVLEKQEENCRKVYELRQVQFQQGKLSVYDLLAAEASWKDSRINLEMEHYNLCCYLVMLRIYAGE